MFSIPKPIRHLTFSCLNRLSCPFTVNDLMTQAMKKTGLSDWGGLPFQEPLERLIDSLHREACLNQQGEFIVKQNYLRLLCNILQIVHDQKTYTGIVDVPIQSPLFIIGFPRTGTTFLHQLLACDSRNRTLKYWELMFPSPPVGLQDQSRVSRIRKTRLFIHGIDVLSPSLATIHKLEATGPEECCFIFDHFFLDHINHLVFDIPTYVQYFYRHDPLSSYRFHRSMLQMYGWNTSYDRYLLKAPRHVYCLKTLLEVYPDALIVWTHRDPIAAIPSLCSLSETARRIISDTIDCPRIGRLCLDYFVKEFRAGHPARSQTAPGQILDISYRTLIQEPLDTVKKIYSHFHLPFTGSFESRLHGYLNDKKHDPSAKHTYTLDQYGLKADEIRDRLQGYYKRFGEFL